jgi:transposase
LWIRGTTRHGCDTVRIGCEATGVCAWPRALGLSQPTDPPRPWTVYLLQPRTVHRYAATFARKRAKTDRQDPWRIAEGLGHATWLPRPFPVAERTLALQRLTRHRYHVVRQLTRPKNAAASDVFLRANGLACQPPWPDPWGAAAEAILLQYQTVEDIAAAPLTDLVECLQRGARGPPADPDRPICAIADQPHAVRQGVRIKEPVHILSRTLEDIRHLEAQIRVVDRQIAHEPAARTNRLLTVPGLGPVFRAGILAEIGDITFFLHDDLLAQFAGLTRPPQGSGQHTSETPPLVRTSNASLHRDLVEAANSVRRYDATDAASYRRQWTEGTQPAHHRALVLTARKLARLLFARLRDDRGYDPAHPAVRSRCHG